MTLPSYEKVLDTWARKHIALDLGNSLKHSESTKFVLLKELTVGDAIIDGVIHNNGERYQEGDYTEVEIPASTTIIYHWPDGIQSYEISVELDFTDMLKEVLEIADQLMQEGEQD